VAEMTFKVIEGVDGICRSGQIGTSKTGVENAGVELPARCDWQG